MRCITLLGLVVLGALSGAGSSAAQEPSALVFDDSTLPTIRIEIAAADLDRILAPGNELSDVEYPATFTFDSPLLQASVDSIGFRLRGNTSRNSQKKSFKVSFNAFVSGRKFEGLEKLNLNGEHNDPSIMRSKVSWDLFSDFSVPASRANHVRLYINDRYYGLYLNVEHFDEQFLDRVFGNDSGNLYKCLWPGDLTVLGPDADAYRPSREDRRPYDLKLKDDDALGYDDLADFIRILNQSPDISFQPSIERVFDVPGFLKALAVTTLTGSWDTYWFLKNNFYLYNDPETGRFRYIPFDFDNSFGIWWDGISPGITWSTRSIYQWGHPSEPRPLTERILAVPEYRERYTYYLRRLLEEYFQPEELEEHILSLKGMTQDAAEEDPFRVYDYGFSVQDYHDSFTEALASREPQFAHVTEGLIPFIYQRFQTAYGQLDDGPIAPLLSDVHNWPERPAPGQDVRVSVMVEGYDLRSVTLSYWPARPEEFVIPMDHVGGGRYQAVIPALSTEGTIDYRIEAVGEEETVRTSRVYSVSARSVQPGVVINEFMALNESAASDDAGEFDDWVELYNAGTATVSLAGFSLSDNLEEPDPWLLPGETIDPGAFLLIWTDGQTEQGPLHASFRLSGDGERVVLRGPGGALVDSVSFGAQTADLSWGRTVDGGLDWGPLSAASPGESNAGSVAVRPLPEQPTLNIYPNPADDFVRLSGLPAGPGTLEVYDALGRRVYRTAAQGPSIQLDSSRLAPGLYFIRLEWDRLPSSATSLLIAR